ncbi:helix-turn-helix transcriptional regulator [Chitinivorax sp. B]|uniref:helix-turn-helix transcriptional regulator n=1 Tax=Chitinivorax sp. B TaxID=2502235 RepID=UPI0020173812|nr:helix-turn-helix transcriptional regulator [Chitinivorax sp. B]
MNERELKNMIINILESAQYGTLQEFQAIVANGIQRGVGFDGLVWGAGRQLTSGAIDIELAYLEGRDKSLLSDYQQIAEIDPTSQKFMANPQLPQNITVACAYQKPSLTIARDYLNHYDISQILLCGLNQNNQHTFRWMTFYRGDDLPFNENDVDLVAFLVPLIHRIEQLRHCTTEMQKMAHQADPAEKYERFSTLTQKESEVAFSYIGGNNYKDIARMLGMAPNTVRRHLWSIYQKLEVHSRSTLRMRLLG